MKRTLIGGGGCVAKRKNQVIPEYRAMTDFLRGQASRIFSEVKDHDRVIIVNKQNKPQVVIISYERYVKIKERNDCDI